MIGVEPTWITPLDPKSSASANFATSGVLTKLVPCLAVLLLAKGRKSKGMKWFFAVLLDFFFGSFFLK